MSQRQKEFDRWKTTKDHVQWETVEAILLHFFHGRTKYSEGGSHNLLISLPELTDVTDFEFGHLSIPLSGGQGVKPRYLKLAYKAHTKLEELRQNEDDSASKEID